MRVIFIFLLFFTAKGVLGQDFVIPQNIRYLALGDSYTIGQGVNGPYQWPTQLSDSLVDRGYQLDSLAYIATTGWTTQSLLNAITNQNLEDKNFNLVSVLIGVNNQYQGQPFNLFLTQFPQLLDSAIVYAGGDTSSVFVLSIPDYAYTPFGQLFNPNQISQEIDQYNAAKDSICQEYGIKYFNITPISREGLNDPALVASDDLHPSREQYTLWVEEILTCVPMNSSNNLHEFDIHPVRVYPNPARSEIFVDDFELFESYTISDMTGKVLEKQDFLGNVISIKGLSNGNYLLHLKNDGDEVKSVRFVVDR
ncbi:MAG: GDSL-type esterase/lipase family protein [bacterium]|nr:GDSL-type esterase/lipase family protein [bacterium]